MKKKLLFLTIFTLITAGCSKTWSGIKQDTHEVIEDTKEVIHEATAPEQVVPSAPTAQKVVPLPSITPPVEEVETVKPITPVTPTI